MNEKTTELVEECAGMMKKAMNTECAQENWKGTCSVCRRDHVTIGLSGGDNKVCATCISCIAAVFRVLLKEAVAEKEQERRRRLQFGQEIA